MKPLAPIAPTSMPDLDLVVEQLCAPSSLETVLHHPLHDSPMPSLEELGEIMSRLKATLFPGYFGVSCVHVESMRRLPTHLGQSGPFSASWPNRSGAAAASPVQATPPTA